MSELTREEAQEYTLSDKLKAFKEATGIVDDAYRKKKFLTIQALFLTASNFGLKELPKDKTLQKIEDNLRIILGEAFDPKKTFQHNFDQANAYLREEMGRAFEKAKCH